MPRPKILVIGSCNIDFVMQLPKLPAVGETITDGQFMQAFGGKGANQAVAAARAGGDVQFIACTGNDVYADSMLLSWKNDGMDVSRVVRTTQAPTGAALIMAGKAGENYLAVAPGANYQLRPEHVTDQAGLIASADWVILQMEIAPETTRRILDIARQSGTKVLLNFAPVSSTQIEISPAVTGLVVNEHEAAALTGTSVKDRPEAITAARTLLGRGPLFVAITLGAQGTVVVTKNEEFHVPARPVHAIDTTAAGDTFCGALAVALGEGGSLRQAVEFATAAAAISVTRIGAQPSIPSRAEIDAMLPQ